MEKQKTKTMAAKRQKAKGGINLSSEKEGNYQNDTEDEMDLDQTNNKYLLQL